MAGNTLWIDLEGLDLAWFATDSLGYIGFFTTGGWGPVPRSAIVSRASLDKLHRYFFKEAHRQTASADAPGWEARAGISQEDARANPIRNQQWRDMAEKGLYAYDAYQHRNHPAAYFKRATPTIPIRVDDLPEDVRQLLNTIVLKIDSFAHADDIQSEELGNFIPTP
jgi:hypothetical protein